MLDKSAPPASPQILLAISFMIAAGIVNTAMLSAIKQLSDSLHPIEIGFFRSAFGFLFLVPILIKSGGIAVLRTDHLGLHLLRGLINAGAMLSFFWAISLAPLATVTAISFASPIFATLLAILILGEIVGLRRWTGLAIGVMGTILILRPGSSEFGSTGAMLALLSSIGWAGVMIIIKRLTGTDNPLSIVAWAALLIALFTLIPAMLVWQWPSGTQWFWLAMIGALGSIVQYCFTKAFSLADATLVLPFDYLKLVWASIAGFVLFSEFPDIWVWAGGTLIFGSSVYIAYRERTKAIH